VKFSDNIQKHRNDKEIPKFKAKDLISDLYFLDEKLVSIPPIFYM